MDLHFYLRHETLLLILNQMSGLKLWVLVLEVGWQQEVAAWSQVAEVVVRVGRRLISFAPLSEEAVLPHLYLVAKGLCRHLKGKGISGD